MSKLVKQFLVSLVICLAAMLVANSSGVNKAAPITSAAFLGGCLGGVLVVNFLFSKKGFWACTWAGIAYGASYAAFLSIAMLILNAFGTQYYSLSTAGNILVNFLSFIPSYVITNSNLARVPDKEKENG